MSNAQTQKIINQGGGMVDWNSKSGTHFVRLLQWQDQANGKVWLYCKRDGDTWIANINDIKA